MPFSSFQAAYSHRIQHGIDSGLFRQQTGLLTRRKLKTKISFLFTEHIYFDQILNINRKITDLGQFYQSLGFFFITLTLRFLKYLPKFHNFSNNSHLKTREFFYPEQVKLFQTLQHFHSQICQTLQHFCSQL